jgi:succinate dehydrogenase hydrophobic anchor subunit
MGVKFGVCFLLIRPVVGQKVVIVLNFFSQPAMQSNHIITCTILKIHSWASTLSPFQK